MFERGVGALAQFLMQFFELVVRKIFGRSEAVLGFVHREDQLRELELQRHRVAVLRVLNQEHHQERDDRGRRIDHELPRVAVAEQRTAHGPNDHRPCCEQERDRLAHPVRGHAGRAARTRLTSRCISPATNSFRSPPCRTSSRLLQSTLPPSICYAPAPCPDAFDRRARHFGALCGSMRGRRSCSAWQELST